MVERIEGLYRGMAGVTLGNDVFTDLDFADDVALLVKRPEVLVLAMANMQETAAVFGLQINWSKNKILQVSHPCLAQQSRWQMEMLKWSTRLST